MKITSIELSNTQDTITINLNNPGSTDPYLINQIVGLDADEIVSRFYSRGLAQPTNEYYGLYDLVLPKREVTISVMMNPRYTLGDSYSKLRDMMYKMISGGRYGLLNLTFKDGLTSVAKLQGFVTKLETPQFSSVQELNITIICRDPILRGVTEVSIAPSTLNAINDIATINDPLSTCWHGIRYGVQFISETDTYRIWNVLEGWEFYIYYSYGFKVNDRLRISTEHNNKYVTLNYYPTDPNYGAIVSAAGIPLTSIADKVEPLTTGWPLMFPGNTTFNFNAASYNWFSFYYTPAYWGV